MPSSSMAMSKCTVHPDHKSTIKTLKLSVSDLPMLSCQYIQKGVLLSKPPIAIETLIPLLKLSLSKTLTHFPALAGRLSTDSAGHVHIVCNDSGVDFISSEARHLFIDDIIRADSDVHGCFKQFFAFDSTLSYAGHWKPIAAVQVTEIGDGVFVGCTVNHAVVDGTSFWNFFNTFAEICKTGAGNMKISNSPYFRRDNVFNSPVVLPVPEGGPVATFSGDEPLRERIFHFSREAILKTKTRANSKANGTEFDSWRVANAENGQSNGKIDGRITSVLEEEVKENGGDKQKAEISSFQSLCALLWRSVTRARRFEAMKTTTFRMAVNCRNRLEPKVDPLYFGNLIQSIPTSASVGELLSSDLNWSADLLHHNVVARDDIIVRRGVKDWESSPRLFPLGNFDGAMITMGSSPRFPMYNNDFGWGRPLAIRSGKANKFDGKISAFPGREGDGSVDLEVVLAPKTMEGLEIDTEFMQYVS